MAASDSSPCCRRHRAAMSVCAYSAEPREVSEDRHALPSCYIAKAVSAAAIALRGNDLNSGDMAVHSCRWFKTGRNGSSSNQQVCQPWFVEKRTPTWRAAPAERALSQRARRCGLTAPYFPASTSPQPPAASCPALTDPASLAPATHKKSLLTFVDTTPLLSRLLKRVFSAGRLQASAGGRRMVACY